MQKGILLLVTLGLALTGCASPYGHQSSLMVEAKKNAPVVYIYPEENNYQEARVGVLAFQVPANMKREQGEGVGLLFKDVLLGKQTFPKVVFLEESYLDIPDALARGKKAKVDLVLAGRVTHALEGSQFGGGRVEVAIRLLNVHTGNTVWYIEQSMDQPMNYPKDGTLTRFIAAFNPPEIKASQGGPALANMLARIAFDMSEIIAGAGSVSK